MSSEGIPTSPGGPDRQGSDDAEFEALLCLACAFGKTQRQTLEAAFEPAAGKITPE